MLERFCVYSIFAEKHDLFFCNNWLSATSQIPATECDAAFIPGEPALSKPWREGCDSNFAGKAAGCQIELDRDKLAFAMVICT
jgi:hypothetical protein